MACYHSAKQGAKETLLEEKRKPQRAIPTERHIIRARQDIESYRQERTNMKFPKTLNGWIKLFWITLRRCPFCHGPLCQDWALYDDGRSLWCLSCGVVRLPKGFFRALKENELATKQGR